MPLVFLCWVVTMLAAGVAALLTWEAFTRANGAPQQAAGAALAVAVVVVPYVFTRAIEGMVTISARAGVRPAPPAVPAPSRREPEFRTQAGG